MTIDKTWKRDLEIIENYLNDRKIFDLTRKEALELCEKLNIEILNLPKSCRTTKGLRRMLENEFTHLIIFKMAGIAGSKRTS